MKRIRLAAAAAALAAVAAIVPAISPPPGPGDHAAAAGPVRASDEPSANAAPAGATVRRPLRFERNEGQFRSSVRFLARTPAYSLALERSRAVIALPPGDGGGRARSADPALVQMRFLGAEGSPSIIGIGRLPGVTNYLIGDDEARWRTGVPSFGRVRYDDLYDGIALLFRQGGAGVEYDFIVEPGADPAEIGLSFTGARGVSLEGEDLVLTTPGGKLRQRRPTIFQTVDGSRRPVPGGFALAEDGTVRFRVGAYDAELPLVIDPELEYSTYLGAGGGLSYTSDGLGSGHGIAVDEGGSAYVTGRTSELAFPATAGAFLTAYPGGLTGCGRPCFTGYVSKLSPDGTSLVYSTFLGSPSSHTFGTAIDVDADGAAWVVLSGCFLDECLPITDFPTVNPLATWGTNAIAKLSPDGSALQFATYFDGAEAVAVDGRGAAYVTGLAQSGDFPPITPGAIQPACRCPWYHDGRSVAGSATFTSSSALFAAADVGRTITAETLPVGTTILSVDAADQVTLSNPATGSGSGLSFRILGRRPDAFVTKLRPSGTVAYSTYLGGSRGEELGTSIAVDGSRAAYVTGSTTSSNFPATPGAYQAGTGCGPYFTAKLVPDGSSLAYATCWIGGDGGVAVDRSGNAMVMGRSSSDTFPATTPGAVQATRRGGFDAYVAKLDPEGDALIYGTYLGGSGNEGGSALDTTQLPHLERIGRRPYVGGIAAGAGGQAYVVTHTASTNFPFVAPLSAFVGGDCGDGSCSHAVLVQLDAAGSRLVYATPLAGTDHEQGAAVALDASNAAYLTGVALSADFPTTLGALRERQPPGYGAFVAKVGPVAPGTPIVTNLVPRTGSTSGGTEVTITGTGFRTATAVRFGSTASPSFTVISARRIVATAPAQLAGSADVHVTVTTSRGTSPANPIARFVYGQGSWSPGGQLSTARLHHSAARLQDGQVLVAGGTTSGSDVGIAPLASAELYDPATGAWTETGSMEQPRAFAAAVLLSGSPCATPSPPTWCGKVLVTGGATAAFPFPGGVQTAELYDPATGTWTETGSMTTARMGHTATVLANGRVMVAGGVNPQGTLSSAEVYDPATGTWAPTASMSTPRHSFTATLLTNGTVIAVGGCCIPTTTGGITFSSTEVFDPAANGGAGAWTAGPSLGVARCCHGAALLSDGRLLVAGGTSFNYRTSTDSLELFDPAAGGGAGAWSPVGLLPIAASWPAAARLQTGPVLVAGGSNSSYHRAPVARAALYDPVVLPRNRSAGLMRAERGFFSRFLFPPPPGPAHTATPLEDGRVLVVGGGGRAAELYTP